jgi:hypothetical protein
MVKQVIDSKKSELGPKKEDQIIVTHDNAPKLTVKYLEFIANELKAIREILEER